MNSLVERLVESWLDNQTERRYQRAFLQALLSDGWHILHNTRHSPIEFGKDVIARDSAGILHCFQLKGNPGTRLTKSEAQGLLPQLVELIDIPVPESLLAGGNEPHVAIFVTNGEIDEEARLLFERAGSRINNGVSPCEKLEIWCRGNLLDLFIRHSGAIWPTTLEGSRLLLELFSGDGLDNPDPKTIGALLEATAPAPDAKSSEPHKDSSITSLFVLAEIIKSRWYKSDNHFALFVLTVTVCIYAMKFATGSRRRFGMIAKYASSAIDHCLDLLKEAEDKHFDPELIWAQFDPLAEVDVMGERRRLMGIAAAVLTLSAQEEFGVDPKFLKRVISAALRAPTLWGFGAVPGFIVKYWALCRLDATNESELELIKKLQLMLSANGRQGGSQFVLPSPYYGFFDCWAKQNNILFVANDNIHVDVFAGRCWFARPILLMLAKRNYKKNCRSLWPSFTHRLHEDFEVSVERFFDAVLSKEGWNISRTFRSMDWHDLVKEAVDVKEAKFLSEFADLAWLVAAYIAVVPYRSWDIVVMWLDKELSETFYHSGFTPA